MIEQFDEAGRDVDERVPVAPAGFDQQDLRVSVLGQPVGQHAAGRAGADDNVIRLHASALPRTRFGPLPDRFFAHSLGAKICARKGASAGPGRHERRERSRRK